MLSTLLSLLLSLLFAAQLEAGESSGNRWRFRAQPRNQSALPSGAIAGRPARKRTTAAMRPLAGHR
jgi:hypothetical protein